MAIFDRVRRLHLVQRHMTTEATSGTHLEEFLRRFKACGKYFLGCLFLDPKTGQPGQLGPQFILKGQFNVREAWQVGKGDVDGMGILPGDTPIIPAGVENAPVLELLRWKGRPQSGRT